MTYFVKSIRSDAMGHPIYIRKYWMGQVTQPIFIRYYCYVGMSCRMSFAYIKGHVAPGEPPMLNLFSLYVFLVAPLISIHCFVFSHEGLNVI